ncbi:MAG: aldolase/citrate lyase family protein [Rectinemataceae bacterium]|nr:aldolase/citrate lyase family protein [Spirochaetaceae bacterium]
MNPACFSAGSLSKSDCCVTYEASDEPLSIEVKSSVERLFGMSIRSTAAAMAASLGVTRGKLSIDDDGALAPVLAARIEAALRLAGFSELQTGRKGHLRSVGHPHNRKDRARYARLYLPGNQPHLMINADLFGADVLVFDLEDAVPSDRKLEARILVRIMLDCHSLFQRSERAVRINPLEGPWGAEDLAEVVQGKPDAILLPKCETAEQVQALDAELSRLEKAHGLELGSISIMPLIETAAGVLAAADIARASKRNSALCFGAEDYLTDIQAFREQSASADVASVFADGTILARQMVVLAARAAGIDPLDSVVVDIEDQEALRRSCLAARRIGMAGKAAIHPAQIGVIRECFQPSPEELEWAREILRAAEEAEAEGRGTATRNNAMIDAPVIARARRMLDTACFHKD